MSSREFPYEAKRLVIALIETLEPMVKRDPEQEIRGVAVPVFEAALDVLRSALPDDPVVAASQYVPSMRFSLRGRSMLR
jgi:hypothetical protein